MWRSRHDGARLVSFIFFAARLNGISTAIFSHGAPATTAVRNKLCTLMKMLRELHPRLGVYAWLSSVTRRTEGETGRKAKKGSESIARDRGVIAKGDKEVSVALEGGQYR